MDSTDYRELYAYKNKMMVNDVDIMHVLIRMS